MGPKYVDRKVMKASRAVAEQGLEGQGWEDEDEDENETGGCLIGSANKG